jgi:UDP-2,4-diacetamido-2,4,6-trideoxy-beta-L-altropyranose hydrolase
MSAALLIRADASAQIGTGHVMRCLALAQAWQARGGTAHFVCNAALPPLLAERLRNEGATVTLLDVPSGSAADATATAALADDRAAHWVAIDGYHFDAAYQRRLADAGRQTLFLDDHGHAAHYSADLVLNQNAYAQAETYAQRDPHTRLLLGCKYALLRSEFWPWRGRQRQIAPEVRRVLVTLGGADPENVTLRVIRAFEQIRQPELELTVIVGASNPHHAALADAAAHSPHTVRLLRNVTDMPALMAEADLAVTASGSTCWELLFMGLPALLIEIADNQRPVAQSLAELDVGVRLGWHTDLDVERMHAAFAGLLHDPARRQAMAAYGQQLVDGYGGARVVQQLRGDPLRLSRATANDTRLLWEWANEPAVRRASFRSEPIPWDDHVRWFQARLPDPHFVLYIAWDADDEPVGMIRFDIDGDTATVGVSVAAQHRGKGYAALLIRAGVTTIMRETAVSAVRALVKPDNQPSLRAFTTAGFDVVGEYVYHGHRAVELIRRREP